MSYDQIKEIREAQRLKYNKKIEQEEIENEKLDNIRLQKESHENERIEKIRQEELMCKKHQEYLDSLDVLNKEKIYNDRICPDNNLPINESVIIIFSIFEEQSCDFVQNSILNHLHTSINNSNFDELYTFYISIKEISSTYDNIDIGLILNTLLLIKMNPHFIEILNQSNKLEYIKIIFQEFIKIIEFIRPEFNNSISW